MDLGDLTDIFAKAKPSALPLDVTAQQQSLARRQKLVDALTGMAFQQSPTQMVGRIAVQQSPLEAVAKTFAGGLSGYKQKGIDEQMTGIAKDYNERSRQAIVDALSKPSEQERTQAMLSRPDLPELYSQGRDMQKKLIERGTKYGEEAMKGMSNAGKQRVAMSGDISTGQTLMDKGEQYDPGKVTIDPNTGKPMAAMTGVIGQTVGPNGTVFNKNLQTGQLDAADKASKVSVGVAVAGPKAGAEEFYKEGSKRFHELGKQATMSVANDKALDRLEGSIQSGAASGVGADAVTFLRNLGNTVGMQVDTNKLANSEHFRAESVKLWQDLVNKYGGNRGVTEQESAKIMQMVPQLSQSPQGQLQLIQMLRKINHGTRQEFKEFGSKLGSGFRDPEMQQFIGAMTEGYLMPAAVGGAVQQGAGQPGAGGAGAGGKVKSWKDF